LRYAKSDYEKFCYGSNGLYWFCHRSGLIDVGPEGAGRWT
jgi:hypothetical protein